MIVSLFNKARQADQCANDLVLLHNLDKAQSRRAKKSATALVASPKGLGAIFISGLAQGFFNPSVYKEFKSMAFLFGKIS